MKLQNYSIGLLLSAAISVNAQCPVSVSENHVNPHHCDNPNSFTTCDGSIDISASGGSGNYIYDWMGGPGTSMQSVCPGTYHVDVIDVTNNCTSSIDVVVDWDHGKLGTSGMTTTGVCAGIAGGTASLTDVYGGGGNYTYSWSPGGATAASISGLTPGTYTCIITDATNCSMAVIGTVPTKPAPAITLAKTVVCNANNASGTITPNITTGNAPYTYSWSTIPTQTNSTATGLHNGTYSVLVTDANGCTGTASTTFMDGYIPSPLALNNSPITHASNGCNGQITVTAVGGASPFSYTWSPNNESTNSANNLCAGTYTVCITDANGCTACKNFTINQTTGIIPESENTFAVVSNSNTQGQLEINFNVNTSQKISLKMYSLIGTEVLSQTINPGTKSTAINTLHLTPGVYFIEATINNNRVTKKVYLQ